MSKIKIRPISPDDFPDWLPLWDGNNQGNRDENITATTWSRLTDPESPVHGICAEMDGQMVGIVQYILHPTTGAIEPACYMQDVYVDPEHRKQGFARELVTHLAKNGQKEKWSRMYWVAEANNAAAQNLYKDIGVKLDFTLHILPLGQ